MTRFPRNAWRAWMEHSRPANSSLATLPLRNETSTLPGARQASVSIETRAATMALLPQARRAAVAQGSGSEG